MNQDNPSSAQQDTAQNNHERPAFELSPSETPVTVGVILRETRTQLELSVEQAAQQLRLSSRQILAMEADDYSSLPDRTYARGFLRNYARLLKLNPDEILMLSPLANTPNSQQINIEPIEKNIGEIKVQNTNHTGDWHKWLIPALLLAVVLVGGIFYQLQQQNTRSRQASSVQSSPPSASTPSSTTATEATVASGLGTPTTASATPNAPTTEAGQNVSPPANGSDTPTSTQTVPPSSATATTIAAASAAVSANNTSQAVPTQAAASSLAPSLTPTLAAIAEKKLQFIFSGQSWVEIRDAHNTIIHSRRHEKGEKTEIDGKPPFQMVIGNASEVKLKYKGKDVDLSETSPAGVARFNLN